MKYLITGVAGFIGSHLAEELLKLGNEVIGVDNFITGTCENLRVFNKNKKFTFIKGDLSKKRVYNTLSMFSDIDYVLHHAASISIERSIQNPDFVITNNVSSTVNLLKFSIENGVKKFVLASSAGLYEDSVEDKKESDVLVPLNPYTLSKKFCEDLLDNFNRLYGLPVASLRYFNVFGPRQSLGGYAAVIPKFINKFIDNEDLEVYGDGEQTRDFIYVKDIVTANILACESKSNNVVYNIGSGVSITINDLILMLKKEFINCGINHTYVEDRIGEIKHSVANTGFAKTELKFIPTVSIKDGLKATIDYYNKK